MTRKMSELCLAWAKPQETGVEARSRCDVQNGSDTSKDENNIISYGPSSNIMNRRHFLNYSTN